MFLKILPSILIVIGWFITYLLSIKLQSKKDFNELVSDIISTISEIEILALEYHTELKKINKIYITAKFNELSLNLEKINDKNNNLSIFLIQFKQSITLRNFDGNPESLDVNSEIVRNIGATKQSLVESIEKITNKAALK